MRSSPSATAGELLISYPSTQQAETPTHLLRPAMLWPRSVVLGYAGGFARSRPITQQPACAECDSKGGRDASLFFHLACFHMQHYRLIHSHSSGPCEGARPALCGEGLKT